MNDEAKQWINLHEQMNQGKVNHNSNFYVATDSQEGRGDIQLVTPTQAEVEQAKMQMKRKLSVTRKPSAKRRKKSQVGGKKKVVKKAKPAKGQRGGKRGRKPTKRRRKPTKKRQYKTKKFSAY